MQRFFAREDSLEIAMAHLECARMFLSTGGNNMKKPAWFSLVAVGSLFLISVPQDAQAGAACVRKEFKTTLVKDACTKGGQDEAKKVMKKFLATAKSKNPSVKDCKSCHTSLNPDFQLTPDALEKFQKSGGK
jgi:hypothetical protein